ncbi:MAG: Gfo/Idh/MocA family oxidoreductase [Deinococcales bacterium]
MFKVGIVGVGGIALRHYQGFTAAGAKVIALADISMDNLKKRQQEWDIAHIYTDYQDLIAREDINAISICTPNAYHAPITLAAAKTGKHVLCEKPISMSLEDAEAMIQACEQAKVVLQIGHHMRSAAAPNYAKKLIQQGAIGDIAFVRLRQSHDWGGAKEVRGVFGSKAHSGGGTLLDNGCHMMDLARYFAGDVEDIFARITKAKFKNIEVEDTSVANVRFASGALGSIENAWTATGWEEAFWIYGTEGALEYTNRYGNPQLRYAFRGGGQSTWSDTDLALYTFQDDKGHLQQEHNFISAIKGEGPIVCSGQDGLEALRLVIAAYESADKNMPITLRDITSGKL